MTSRPYNLAPWQVPAAQENRLGLIVVPLKGLTPNGQLRESPFAPGGIETTHGRPIKLPFAPGDELWCRETWGYCTGCNLHYRRYETAGEEFCEECSSAIPWRSPITMPRWASRFTMRVTDASVKRVQEITEDEAVAAGCIAVSNNCPLCRDGICSAHQPPIGQFSAIHHPIWASNPWCAFGCVERMK